LSKKKAKIITLGQDKKSSGSARLPEMNSTNPTINIRIFYTSAAEPHRFDVAPGRETNAAPALTLSYGSYIAKLKKK
jgi:hypothetical protein